MYIKEIKLENFRNYKQEEIELKKEIILFYGDNAQGKTNLLESIFICALGKSYRAKKDKEIIKIGEDFSNIYIEYEKEDRKGSIKVQVSDKKEVFINNIKVKKLSELLGKLNIVLFTPEDIDILKKSPANRRKFLNIMISQLRPKYAFLLNQYFKIIEQRNALLKQIRINELKKEQLIIWDEKLIQYGYEISNYREEFINKIKQKIKEIHNKITEEKEKVEIEYISDCLNKEEYKKELEKNKKIDIINGYTAKGIHRDDFKIKINNQDVGIYGSQGQNRTVILSLKLSELQIIYDEIGEYPILLLDDFMSELDSKRRKNFLDNISDMQVIITGTEKIETKKKNTIYNVIEGNIIKN